MELRCANSDCRGYWLGEAPERVVLMEMVAKGADVTVQPPRDLRICKRCGCVNVFVTLKDLGLRAA